MPHFSIKDVPAAWAEALRQRALQHHRSLQGELMAILEHALTNAPSPAEPVPRIVQVAPVLDDAPRQPRRGSKTLTQVRQDLQARYPQVITAQVSSVALIREERDQR